MKLRILLLCLIMLPTLANAEIYKWKDKDGHVRYSDVPPPSNIQQETLYGKKIPKPKTAEPLAPVDGDITAAIQRQKAAGKEAPISKEAATKKRGDDAEKEKKEAAAKKAEMDLKAENCKAAQANLKTYTDGGRLIKANEKGERVYLGDKEIDQGKKDAQADVSKYCDS